MTQGPQGTESSVVVEDERRILKYLCDIMQGPAGPFQSKPHHHVTLVVESVFLAMRSGATDMPLQPKLNYRFSRAIKEQLKRQDPFNPVLFTEDAERYDDAQLCLCSNLL